jgi:hypothetical protein
MVDDNPILRTLQEIDRKVDDLASRVSAQEAAVRSLASRLPGIDHRLATIEHRLAAIEGRLGHLRTFGTCLLAGLLVSYAAILAVVLRSQ